MKLRMAKAHSSSSAQRLQRQGWVVRSEMRAAVDEEPYEYILEWHHEWEPPFRELSVVEVARLPLEPREFQGTEGVCRAPQVGDVGAIVHCHAFNGTTYFYEVECVAEGGKTLWLATMEHTELKHAVA
jgi:hypothetical protein